MQVRSTSRAPLGILVSLFLLFGLLLSGCRASNRSDDGSLPGERPPSSIDGPLTVYAASSLTGAMTELVESFRLDHPEIDPILNFNGSSSLAIQLLEGGSADIFASADPIQMERVAEAGLIDRPARIFVHNRLAILISEAYHNDINSLTDLATGDYRLVLAAPGVPARGYTEQLLAAVALEEGADFPALVLTNLVSEEENVRQVITKLALGEADVGIAYRSDLTPDLVDEIGLIKIDERFNVRADYPVARLSEAPNPAAAEAFFNYILSEPGQAILERWGFERAIP